MKKIVLLMVGLLTMFMLSGCAEKHTVVKDADGQVAHNLDGTPVITTVYVGLITGKQYSKDALTDAYALGKGFYVIGKEIVTMNLDVISQSDIDNLKRIDDFAQRVDRMKEIIDTVGKTKEGVSTDHTSTQTE